MKKTGTKERGVALERQNVQTLRKSEQEAMFDTPYWNLLVMLADMADSIARGEDWYCIIGSTKNRDAFSLTVVGGLNRDTVYATNFRDLADKANTFSDGV